jgi:glycosyltransferase involved in cell wall biosynthesis
MSSAPPQLSVVVPLHNEVENVTPLCRAIQAALDPLDRPYEVILVNDGSTDGTEARLDSVAAAAPQIRPLHLAANFGQAEALSAGFEAARAPIIMTLDGDLQNDPAELPRLLEALERGGYRVVSGWRKARAERSATRVLPSRLANWLIARITGLPTRDNGCSLKVYRSEVVKGTFLPHGMHRFIPAVYGVRPHEFAELPVSHRSRQSGKSHYGLSRLFVVIRDLLAIQYLQRDPGAALLQLNAMRIFGGALLLLGLYLLAVQAFSGHPLVLARPLGILFTGAVLESYAETVRVNLQRWLRAQRERTYRLRDAGPAAGAAPREAAATVSEAAAARVRS